MTDLSNVDPVGSGVSYEVRTVNGRSPHDLDDFVAGEVVALTVTSGQQVVEVHGSARRDGDSVVVYEKDAHGTGKDVRTWRIGVDEGRFDAIEQSNF